MSKLFLLMMLIFSLMLSGCASQKLANSDALQSKALADAANVDATPEEMISRASERLNNAAQELRFYSPLHMQKAQEQLEQARKLHQGGKPENRTAVLAAAILAEKLVKQAEDNQEQVKQQLAPALAHRDILIELGSPELVSSDYNSAMSTLNKLIQSVESGQLDYVAKNQPELLEDFIEVEASTLKVKWLNRAKVKLEEADDADADKFAPKSFEQAELAIERADAYINTNYRDRVGVKAKTDEAFVLASKALNITHEVQKIYEKKISELENYMLDVQSWLDNINQDVKVADLAALTFYDQSRAIAARVFELVNTQMSATVPTEIKQPTVVEESVETFPMNETQALPLEAELKFSPIEETNDTGIEATDSANNSANDEPNEKMNEEPNETVTEASIESDNATVTETANDVQTEAEGESESDTELADPQGAPAQSEN